MPEELSSAAGKREAVYSVSPTGLDQVQCMLGAGPGEPLRPLSAVASGGESARIMLALKAAPAAAMAHVNGHRDDASEGTLLLL